MNAKQVVEMLRKEVEKAGGQRAWARNNGLSSAHVNDVLHGNRKPADAICKGLGLIRILVFRKRPVK